MFLHLQLTLIFCHDTLVAKWRKRQCAAASGKKKQSGGNLEIYGTVL